MKDLNVLETFQAMIDGKFAPLTIMNNANADINSMITTFNTAVTETASEILGKHRQKKKLWATADILDLCDKKRELWKKRFEPGGSEKYKEVSNSIKRCTKKAKENWIEEQCREIEENLRKNNSKRAYQLVKDLTTVTQGKAITVQDRSGKSLTEELQRRIQAMEMRCCRKILHISYKDHPTNEEVCAKIQQAVEPHKDLLTIVKRRKLRWYGHVSFSSRLAKTILQGTVKGRRR